MSKTDEILATALHLAYEHGYDGLRIEDIGRQSGLTGPAIYRYVGKKRDILEALFDEALDQLLVRVGQPTGTAAQQLEALVRAHVGFALENVQLLTVYVREDRALPAPARRRLHAREREYRLRWTDALSRARPALSDDQVTTLVAGAIGLVGSIAYWPEPVREAATRSDLIVNMVLRLLEGSPAA